MLMQLFYARMKLESVESSGIIRADFFQLLDSIVCIGIAGQFASVHEKIDGIFAAVEEMLKKLLKTKPNTTVPDTKEATSRHGSGGNLNLLKGRKDQAVETLDGEDGMPPLEPISREEMSIEYERRGANFARIRVIDEEDFCKDGEREGDQVIVRS
ncbi:hypothetical protein M5K25_013571 [Dendrobium thyrsiflorum]|uniref:Uncharacterized protein n=1 Tax=Dendrobium thyrsiflorum TaxID=117978 RepID=A0ABD0UU42_DENTH